MAFYHILDKRSSLPSGTFLGVAFLVLQKSLGGWHAGYSRHNPEIPVLTIQNISPSRIGNLGRLPAFGERGESRWKRGIRASLRFFKVFMGPLMIAMGILGLADPVQPSGSFCIGQKKAPASNQGEAEGPWRPKQKPTRAVAGIVGKEISA